MLNVHRLEYEIAEQMEAENLPGLALAVIHDNEIVYARGFGVSSVEDGAAISELTLFQIGSTTKPLTGTMIMRLVDEGARDLDQPVAHWIPELTLHEPGAAEALTLRMLLTHTSGLPWNQITPGRVFGRRVPEALTDWVHDELPQIPLLAPPGALWFYSNAGINLAARVAEAAAGKTYADLMDEYVFGPLEMKRSTFDPTVAMTWPLAQSHERLPDGALRVQHRFADNVAQYPSAFAFSSALELANFALMHLQDGRFDGERLLNPDSVTLMHSPLVSRSANPKERYGLTFFVDTWRGVQRVSHPGGIQNFACNFDLAPDAGSAVIMLYNQGEFASRAPRLVDEILADLLDLPAGSNPT